ncbi:hypothetical protein J2S64_002807 [Paeniglutamicibacter sulfureus]|uniref:Uncharacterized protein n=1 Tax=Paeniglutamicibacter sulfureus TaxID=43666 RepID=A0ABU2BKE8_9MICC|nr:hypothetical protein [Paeniglutamicibacter psychrophenolicus]MDR7359116.1 hypothetical protein [Paeniglutamicibacter sulfureus]
MQGDHHPWVFRAALAGEHAVRGPQSSAPRYARSSSSGSS